MLKYHHWTLVHFILTLGGFLVDGNSVIVILVKKDKVLGIVWSTFFGARQVCADYFDLEALHRVTEGSLSKGFELATSLRFWHMLQEVYLKFNSAPFCPICLVIDIKIDAHLPGSGFKDLITASR